MPASMRHSRTTPLVELPEPGSYEATVRATAAQLPRWSKYITGTTAHRHAYYQRRQVAESANAALHGEFVDVNSRYFRVFERHKINVLLAFTVAGYNHDRIRAFRATYPSDQPEADGLHSDLDDTTEDDTATDTHTGGSTDPPDTP